MKQLEYNVSYPSNMEIECKYGSPEKVMVLIDILTPTELWGNIPSKIAIVNCDECGQSGAMLFGEDRNGKWHVNWDVSRPLANILMQVIGNKIDKDEN